MTKDKEPDMAEWMDMTHWPDCARLARPGYVFEVANAEGDSLFTPCVQVLPVPWDWKSAPVRFRLAAEKPARHSQPTPEPNSL